VIPIIPGPPNLGPLLPSPPPDPFSPENDDLNKCAQFANGAGVAPLGQVWADVNVDFGFGTGGVYVNTVNGDWHPYLGLGAFTPGGGLYMTNAPAPGLGFTANATLFAPSVTYNYDHSGSSGEVGWGTPGAGIGGTWTW
jgi:hypothetical protein